MSTNRQLDLFVAFTGDVPFWDERDAMSASLVALSKNKRTRIEWEGPSGQKVLVTAPEDTGISTIWDYDVLLWAVSQINEAVNAGLPVSARIEFHPYNLLKAVGRDTGSKGYGELKAALHRLGSTSVAYESPSLKRKRRNLGRFNLLSAFKIGKNRDSVLTCQGTQPRLDASGEAVHRTCQFLDGATLPDNMLIAIGSDDAAALAVLSSRFHVTWALKAGGTLEDRPRYNKSLCFDPFPFPDSTEEQKALLRHLGEQLDKHRKVQQAANPKLTLTGMYNVLEKLRAGDRIEGKDRDIYNDGLIGILRDLHDKIDTAVADAYGWPADLSDDAILHRLVDLNRERAAEEARGHIRYLRPDYQNPDGRAGVDKGDQGAFDIGPTDTTDKAPWPKSLPEQIAAVQAALYDMGEATPEQIARQFVRGRAGTVQPLLESLTALGQARPTEGGRFAV